MPSQAYRLANPDKIRETSRLYYQRNSERIKERCKKYRLENKHRIQAYNRSRYAADPVACRERVKQWSAAHRDKEQARSRRYAARRKASDSGQVSDADIDALFAATNGTCTYCGAVATELDHIIPLSRGGEHSVVNLNPTCPRCNKSKGAKLISEWHRDTAKEMR